MATITEDYVSFETAKLLKEKGFDQNCATYYLDGQVWRHYHSEVIPKGKQIYAAPTQAIAIKWFREVHDKNIILYMLPENNDCYVLWTFNVISNKNYKIMWGIKQPKYNTYAEACEAAIKYCLENLITNK